MKRLTPLPELLSPAGTPEALTAAVNAGADAVYVGASAFNARAFAKNFTDEDLRRGIAYAHVNGRKVYVTLNTQLYDKEIPDFLRVAATVREAGADGVIVADLGCARLLHEAFPDLPLHASTQMSVHNVSGADALLPFGISRVVPARELSLSDIITLTATAKAEVEVFLHGALCVSHSGQCLMSAMIGGRSGNRGECAQPCRLPYNGKHPLSLSDLSLAGHIPELLDSGVASLKIEGRMKSPAYVYGVTKIYRRLLDEKRNATPEENACLAALFSRSGFTDGYFTGRITTHMTGIRREEDKDASATETVTDTEMHTFPISGSISVKSNENAKLTLFFKDKSVTVAGDAPVAAISRPLTEDGIYERLSKLGNTFFTLDRGDLKIDLESGLNLSPASLNALRRAAVEKLAGNTREPALQAYTPSHPVLRHASPAAFFYKTEQVTAKARTFFEEIYLLPDEALAAPFLSDGVILPPVVFDSETADLTDKLKRLRDKGVKRAVCQNLGHFALAEKIGFSPLGGYRLNTRNSETAESLRLLFGVDDLILSPELTLPQCRDIGGRAIVYGRLPLMLLERCFVRENFGCSACGRAAFTDRTGTSFPLLRLPPHRNMLLNSLPTYMGDKRAEVKAAGLSEIFLFTVETPKEVDAVIAAFEKREKPSSPVRRMGIVSPVKAVTAEKSVYARQAAPKEKYKPVVRDKRSDRKDLRRSKRK